MKRLVNVSRPCYDKMHRCPGWIGGGMLYPREDLCEGGYVTVDYERRGWKWRTHRCNKCSVLVLPWVVRWVDWRWWKSEIQVRRRWRS